METTGMLQESVERIQQALLQTYVPTTQQQQQQQGIAIQTSSATGISGQLVTQIHPVVGANIPSIAGEKGRIGALVGLTL